MMRSCGRGGLLEVRRVAVPLGGAPAALRDNTHTHTVVLELARDGCTPEVAAALQAILSDPATLRRLTAILGA